MQSSATARANLAAVAARAGVSASTASLAFSGAGPVSDSTRARVLAAAAELGYAGPDPRARSLRRGRSGIVGVVLDDELRLAFSDPINIVMMDGIASVLAQAGGSLLLLSGDAAQLASAPVDAVVLVGCSPRVADLVEPLRRRSVPVVAIEADAMPGVAAIDLDNREASRALAGHLRDLGHERVAILALPIRDERERGPIGRGEGSVHATVERIRGVRDVFPDADGLVALASSVEEGITVGRELLLGDTKPTAVIAQSDLLAIGVIRAARELGLVVPADLSVVGFDGVRLDGLSEHDLTTMTQPARDKGVAAARAALAMIDGDEPTAISFTSSLHLGATAAPPP